MNKKLKISLIAIGGIALVAFIIGYLMVRVRKRTLELTLSSGMDSQGTNQSGGQASQQSEGLTYSKQSYKTMADELERSMRGLGTDEDALYGVFMKLHTTPDFFELDDAFGKRDGANMSEWVLDDVSSYWINKINSLMRSRNIQASIG